MYSKKLLYVGAFEEFDDFGKRTYCLAYFEKEGKLYEFKEGRLSNLGVDLGLIGFEGQGSPCEVDYTSGFQEFEGKLKSSTLRSIFSASDAVEISYDEEKLVELKPPSNFIKNYTFYEVLNFEKSDDGFKVAVSYMAQDKRTTAKTSYDWS